MSHDPDQFHERYITGDREMAPRVARQALLAAGLDAGEIDFLVFVSSTGYACPGFVQELAHSFGVQGGSPGREPSCHGL